MMRNQPIDRVKYIVPFVYAMLLFVARVQAQQSPHGRLEIPCTDCHTTTSWKTLAQPMVFKHSTTGFDLLGKHGTAACVQCHTTKIFTDTPTACFDCHHDDFAKALEPNHALGKFSQDCATCHTFNAWVPSVFQHSKTNFQLLGAHQTVECTSCHTNFRFEGLSKDCFSCHQQIYNQTSTPNHRASLLSHDCTTCHSMTAWKPATFDHQKTMFQLVGAHQSVDCASCHKNGQYKALSTDCFTCHATDFTKSISVNHVTAQFTHDCTTCHTMNSWKPSTFEHSKTNFPLLGAHITADCASCHKNGQFKGTATDCYTCHATDFTKSVTSNHVTGQFSHDCTMCHTMNAWKPATLDHSKTNFPLLGAHIATDCALCHKNGAFKGTPTDCYTCHTADFTKSTTANHVTGQFSHDCTMCHTMNAWKPATIDHSKTNFPLLGAHITTDCASCHKNGVFKGTPTDCYTCHTADFAKSTTTNHVTGQFSHDCTTCHSMTAWKPSTFSHANTNFQLTGAHAATDCIFCHKNGVFKGTPTDCYSCHTTNFTGVTDPNHVSGNFDHNCATCHATTAWSPATFDHSKALFPLTGAHVQTPCAKCHVGGKYVGLNTDCYTCHLADFTSAKVPDHAAGQYPHDCQTCHSTSVWQPWTFNHNTYYLISKHHGSSVTCANCHTTPGNLALASCTTGCHSTAHNKTQTCYTSNCHGGSKN